MVDRCGGSSDAGDVDAPPVVGGGGTFGVIIASTVVGVDVVGVACRCRGRPHNPLLKPIEPLTTLG